jgi:hypothetical protein
MTSLVAYREMIKEDHDSLLSKLDEKKLLKSHNDEVTCGTS